MEVNYGVDTGSAQDYSIEEVETKAAILEQSDLWKRSGNNWRVYVDANHLTDREASKLNEFTESTEDERVDLWDELGRDYAVVFIKALNEIHQKDRRQYLLTLLESCLSENPALAIHFRVNPRYIKEEEEVQGIINPYHTFSRIIMSPGEDGYSTGKAKNMLAILYRINEDEAEAGGLGEFISHLVRSFTAGISIPNIMRSIYALKEMLKSPLAQSLLVKQDAGLRNMLEMLSNHSSNIQLLYEIHFCFWLLSFNAALMDQLPWNELIYRTVQTMRHVTKEKVLRVCCSTLRNLIQKEEYVNYMIGCKLPELMEKLMERILKDDKKDEDLVRDLKDIDNVLHTEVKRLSSFDMYKRELTSGHLKRGPVHGEQFWRTNISRFEENNFNLIRMLVKLLDPEREEEEQEMACYDVGEFARFHQDGKFIITKLGGKIRLMELMSSHSISVAKQALLATQKLMVGSWEALQAQGGITAL